jgi:hypothetical protein
LSRRLNFTPIWKNYIHLIVTETIKNVVEYDSLKRRYLWENIDTIRVCGSKLWDIKCRWTDVDTVRCKNRILSYLMILTYLRPILNSMRFTELRITGKFWPEMPQIMDNVSTLLSLDLSSNRIEAFTVGKSSFRTEN